MEEWRERGRGEEEKGEREREGGRRRKRERPLCLESYYQDMVMWEEFFLSSKALDQPSMEILRWAFSFLQPEPGTGLDAEQWCIPHMTLVYREAKSPNFTRMWICVVDWIAGACSEHWQWTPTWLWIFKVCFLLARPLEMCEVQLRAQMAWRLPNKTGKTRTDRVSTRRECP